MKNYNELFNERFRRSQEIDENFSKIMNEEGLLEAINYLKSIGVTTLDMDNYQIKYRISEWTKNKTSNEEKERFINELLKLKNYINKIDFTTNEDFSLPELSIETTKSPIRAIQFSSVAPKCKEKLPFIETDERHGRCYEMAQEISLNLGIRNNIVTGYIYGYSNKSKFLHSWVETTIKGKEYVIDGTLNSLINKQGYYFMQHANPISKISNKTFLNDIKNYLEKMETFPIEIYYVFRDEIIKDFQKNEELFER